MDRIQLTYAEWRQAFAECRHNDDDDEACRLANEYPEYYDRYKGN